LPRSDELTAPVGHPYLWDRGRAAEEEAYNCALNVYTEDN
jgi:hypothetical protein